MCMSHYNGKSSLHLETDAARSRALGMALWQQHPNGHWHLLQCGSRHVSRTEARYSATEIELLAVVWAVGKARLYLAGSDFELIVDHRPLVPIINSKTLDELSSPRIIRLKEKLSMYRKTAVGRPGVSHQVVDCLSRNPVDEPNEYDLAGKTDVEHSQMVLQQITAYDTDTGDSILCDEHIKSIRTESLHDPEY